jgi:hypothetical protein
MMRGRKGSGDLPGLQSRRFDPSRAEWWIRLPHASANLLMIGVNRRVLAKFRCSNAFPITQTVKCFRGDVERELNVTPQEARRCTRNYRSPREGYLDESEARRSI